MEKKNKKINLSYLIERNIKNRKYKDGITNGSTFLFSLLCVVILFLVIGYVLFTGANYLTPGFITSNYSQSSVALRTPKDFVYNENDYDFSDLERFDDTYYSEKWGIGLQYGKDNNQNQVIYLVQMSENSPFHELVRRDDGTNFNIPSDMYLSYITVQTELGTYKTAFSEDGIENMISTLDEAVSIYDSNFLTLGGGISTSLITTCYLILFTLIFSLPLGIGGAIYLGYYAKDNRITRIIRSLVDMSSGIPSIIFGLVGATIFIPFVGSMTGTTGGNIFTGALTMTLILLPTIVKTVEESIKTIPKSMISASLALGASNTETIFKIVLPNSIDGILNAAILGIGRTIGESAALVFALGTFITAAPSFTSGNTTLAVHIWYILAGEYPAYEQACAISIIIFCVVIVLSLSTKLINYLFRRKRER